MSIRMPWAGRARVVRQSADEFILEKPLEDGSVAVGLFNLSESSRTMSVSLADLGLNGSRNVRDLWRQKDIGAVSGAIFDRCSAARREPAASLVHAKGQVASLAVSGSSCRLRKKIAPIQRLA